MVIFAAIVLATSTSIPTLPSPAKVTLPGLAQAYGTVNAIGAWMLLVSLLGVLGAGMYFVFEARKGHGSGMHNGHKFLIGALCCGVLIGGAAKIVAFAHGVGTLI